MQTLNVIPGTPAWLVERSTRDTASEASAMMGCGAVSRTELLDQKVNKLPKEYDRWVIEVLFQHGKDVEAMARPFVEEIIGDTLYPVVGVADDYALLASFDGLTLLEDVAWECKQWNEEKAQNVRDGILPECDYWQVVQQLVVSGADKLLYTVTDGTREGSVHLWVFPSDLTQTSEAHRNCSLNGGDFERLIAGWAQFNNDRATHKVTVPTVEAVGAAPEQLPALRIELQGGVAASNLDEFEQHAKVVLASISTDLQTDQDFANAEATVKWAKEVESKLEAAKEYALGQTADIDRLFKVIDGLKEETRQKRLHLDKQVKALKQQRKQEILRDAEHDYDAHLEAIERELETASGQAIRFPAPSPGIQGAMKGKRTISSLQDAADTAVANAKIDADQAARGIRESIKALQEAAKGHETLFPDGGQLVVSKSADDLRNLAKLRIAEHEEQERQRLEAERERIRAEEQAKAERQRQQEELQRQREERQRQQIQQAKTQPEPASEPDKPRPAAAKPTQQAAARRPSWRPDDMAIIGVVAKEFRVDHDTARDWIAEINAVATA